MIRNCLRVTILYLAVMSLVILTSGMAACSLVSTSTPAPKLLSIALAPASPSDLAVGTSMQFFAYGTFSDGSITKLTSQVTWTSDNNGIASIDINGLATGVAVGIANITANMSGITSPAVSLPVILAVAVPTTTTPGPTLISIAITQPATLSINLVLSATKTQQFKAVGTYSDGSTSVITTLVTWVSSQSNVATISSAGFATGITAGTTQITATMPGITSNVVTIYVTAN
jgi:trimeric autotransporter adhesin